MESLVTGLTIFHVVVCILLSIVVLVQFGKGAEAGAMMGSGSSQAIFTSNSKGNFFTKLTTVLAVLFMVNSVSLTILTSKASNKSLFDGEAPVAAPLNDDAQDIPSLNDDAAGENQAAPTAKTNNESTKSADNSEEGTSEAKAE